MSVKKRYYKRIVAIDLPSTQCEAHGWTKAHAFPCFVSFQELVASSPSQRNWRGIFIALLVIAAVLGLIVFSIFLLSPEDEGARFKGRRVTLSDVNGNGLKWKQFNGTWINGKRTVLSLDRGISLNGLVFNFLDGELVYRDPTGGLSIFVTETFTTRVLMTNSTFVSCLPEFLRTNPLKHTFPRPTETIECGEIHNFTRSELRSSAVRLHARRSPICGV